MDKSIPSPSIPAYPTSPPDTPEASHSASTSPASSVSPQTPPDAHGCYDPRQPPPIFHLLIIPYSSCVVPSPCHVLLHVTPSCFQHHPWHDTTSFYLFRPPSLPAHCHVNPHPLSPRLTLPFSCDIPYDSTSRVTSLPRSGCAA